ncbi:hypothetical protein U1Q18_018268, partial [Sarracenia purpurea var. burkii]
EAKEKLVVAWWVKGIESIPTWPWKEMASPAIYRYGRVGYLSLDGRRWPLPRSVVMGMSGSKLGCMYRES